MLVRRKNKPEEISYEKIAKNVYKIYFNSNIKEDDDYYTYDEISIIAELDDDNVDNLIKEKHGSLVELAMLNDIEKQKELNINNLKNKLADTDYKTIKSLENFVLGLPLNYDYSKLIASRQLLRDKINNLENNIVDIEENDLEQAKNRKINEMCATSQSMITNGIDVGNEHYRLNTTDQINLTSLYNMALNGKITPYHADGKVCRLYLPAEMIELVETALMWITYHTTYFNLLKHTILEMDTIEDVNSVFYGYELNDEYKKVLNAITEG